MYEGHFGLRHRPFRPTPDSESYYPATSQERALDRLQRGLSDDEAILVLTGEPGTGKTLLCHCLLERLGDDVTTAFLTNGHVAGRAGLLQAVLFDLSQPYEGRAEQELRLALTDFLLKNFAAGKRAVFVLDEAHHLPADALEELRLLANLESRCGKAVQIVLVGQPSLLETLRRPELAALAQRTAVRVRLDALPLEESADYLLHQLRAAGARPETVVTDEALEVLARGSTGVPRLLNQAAHRALLLAFSAGATLVDAEAALEALTVLGMRVEDTPAEGEDADAAPPHPHLAECEEPSCRLFGAPRRPA